MPEKRTSFRVSTPGRICLFGEHQDYLQLPVIPCAISLRVAIDGTLSVRRSAVIELPDIGSRTSFPLGEPLRYTAERDYFKSAVNVLLRNGFTFSEGIQCVVRGNIPINSGTSSSSALLVSWVCLLAMVSDQKTQLPPWTCARLAHAAEVLEFGEPGGMMDHYSTALGGIIALDFVPEVRYEQLSPPLGTFVLGDSGEPKDTVRILATVKNRMLTILKDLRGKDPTFSLQTATPEAAVCHLPALAQADRELLTATLRNRGITEEARSVLRESGLDHARVGELLNQHQALLRDALGISTPKIDRMLEAAMSAGALGGKINGSGGGGCMFAYAPHGAEQVAEAIQSAGGKAYVVRADEGVRYEEIAVVP